MGKTTDRTFSFKADELILNETNIAGVKALYSTGQSEMATIQFYYDGNVNVDQNVLQPEILVYPNPSNGNFNISLDGKYEVKVISMTGVVVYHNTVTNEAAINLEGLAKGMYIVTAQSADRIARQSIIIK